MRCLAPVILALLLAPAALADERIASEDFSGGRFVFGPDNETRGHVQVLGRTKPFERAFDLAAGSRIATGTLGTGPTDRGSIEDVTWVDVHAIDENALGRWGDFSLMRFETGGPELRLVRSSARPEATLQWFDGINWNMTGAALALDRRYRVRAVMDLDTGAMDVFVREEPIVDDPLAPRLERPELAAVLGASFKPFAPGAVRRVFALGRPSGLRVGIAGWQLWRIERRELVPCGVTRGGPVTLRYVAEATLEGDAVRRSGDALAAFWTLVPTSGMRDDFELPDVSRWSPAARVQRWSHSAASGKWSLALSEGPEPVDTEVRLPPADFDVHLKFLVPKDLRPNRHVYLVRFKNPETGAEPVGPSIYLDYGASATPGKSILIAQQKPDQYYSMEVDVKPGVWYGLTVSTRRALGGYVATFIDEAGKEVPLNDGKPLAFFLGTPAGERVLWRFFSLMAMRPGMTDWPKIDLKVSERRIPVTFRADDKSRPKGLTLRGIRRGKPIAWDSFDSKSWAALYNQSEVIDKNWPEFRIGVEQSARLWDYQAFFIEGGVYLPWSGVDPAWSTNGSMWLMVGGSLKFRPGDATAAGEFKVWKQSAERPYPLAQGVTSLTMLYVPPPLNAPAEAPAKAGELRAEMRWMFRGQAQPIPPELVRGQDVVLLHPGLPFDPAGAALFGDRLLVADRGVGIETYDRNFLRTSWDPSRLEKTISHYYGLSSFAWDPWGECFYTTSTSPQLVVKFDRDFAVKEKLRWVGDAVSHAPGPEGLFFVSSSGDVIIVDRFFGVTKTLPIEKMFGGRPLFSAAACTGKYLYLATREDSPILPLGVICVDTNGWHPIFNVDLKGKFPEVRAMATDGETMAMVNRADGRVATFALPPKHELEMHQTFVCLDDLELRPRISSEDVPLLPGPSGDAEGWAPSTAIAKNPDGEGWLVKPEGPVPTLERRGIVTIPPGAAKESLLRIRLADPQKSCTLRIGVEVREARVQPRVLLIYADPAEEPARTSDAWGRTYSIADFFARSEFAGWRTHFPFWARQISGPVDGVRLRAFRPVLMGAGAREHVFSFEKDFGLKAGDVVDGIFISPWRECPPILSLAVTPSEWVEKTSSSGAVTSRVARLEGEPGAPEAGTGRLEKVTWDEQPYDPARGTLSVSVRCADEKYRIDDVAWTPVENGRALSLSAARFFQWRVEMSTRDPWRPPGVSNLLFTFAAGRGAEPSRGSSTWVALLVLVLIAAALAFLVIGRRSLWERRKKRQRAK